MGNRLAGSGNGAYRSTSSTSFAPGHPRGILARLRHTEASLFACVCFTSQAPLRAPSSTAGDELAPGGGALPALRSIIPQPVEHLPLSRHCHLPAAHRASHLLRWAHEHFRPPVARPPSAGRRSSIRRNWRSFSVSRTPLFTEPWPTSSNRALKYRVPPLEQPQRLGLLLVCPSYRLELLGNQLSGLPEGVLARCVLGSLAGSCSGCQAILAHRSPLLRYWSRAAKSRLSLMRRLARLRRDSRSQQLRYLPRLIVCLFHFPP